MIPKKLKITTHRKEDIKEAFYNELQCSNIKCQRLFTSRCKHNCNDCFCWCIDTWTTQSSDSLYSSEQKWFNVTLPNSPTWSSSSSFFSICLACTTTLSLLFPLFPLHISNFYSFFSPSMFSRRQTNTVRQAVHQMCSDTSSSHSPISQEEMGVWHVYIFFPFLSHQKSLQSPFSSPPSCKPDSTEGKRDADPSLTP